MEHPITSTLFRFVKLRSPQLQDETKKNTTNVIPALEGYFFTAWDNAPIGTIKASAMRQAAESFSSPYESVNDVKDISESLYNFSQWLAKNKTNYIDTDLVDEYEKVTKGLTAQEREIMWDNFYYQAITQKSFYVKEALSEMLLADHAYRLVDTDIEHSSDYNREVVNAKLVLPSELFSDYIKVATDSETSTKYQPNIPTGFLKSQIIVSSAKMRIENYGGLIKELNRSENKYRESYSATYSQAYKQYEEDIAPTLETYRQDLENAKQAYCSVQNPDIPYDPKNPCHQPAYVPYPSLPEFSFSHEDEITAVKMEEELTEKSLNVLLDVLGYDFENDTPEGRSDLLKSYPTYNSIYPEVESARRSASTELVENIYPLNTTVNFAGYDYSVNKGSRMKPDSFNLCAARVNRVYNAFTLTIGVPDNTWQVLKIVITVTKPSDNTYQETINAPVVTYNNGVLSLQSFYTYSIPQIGGDDNDILDFEIIFTNGSIRNIENIDAEMTLCTSGTALGTDPAYNEVNTNPPFVPSKFGFRDLGVADYLKVEQTVQCYVEGEVSHIENIMAREYKERATRMLRRTEETTTVSSETEQERLTDTTTTNRHELQSEISRVISESKDLGASVTANYDGGGSFSVSTGLSYATNTSQENSSRLAETTAQEITERATERIVSKIKEERISKIIEEYEENNKHGFDNRFGSQHVVGVYRWVDKLYKNQIWNYGKRMMLEFMIPDPAELHLLGMEEEGVQNNEIEKPRNPRKPNDPALDPYAIINYASLTEEKIAYWTGYYNVEIEPKPANTIKVGEGFKIRSDSKEKGAAESDAGKVTIPEGYKSKKAYASFSAVGDGSTPAAFDLRIGGVGSTIAGDGWWTQGEIMNASIEIPGFREEVPISYLLGGYTAGDINVTIECDVTQEAIDNWKIKTFNALINAYEEALAEYNDKLSAQQPTVTQKETNPGFYRQIENLVLRKNCISYLIRQIAGGFAYGANMTTGDSFGNFEVNLSQGLDNYTNTVKFLEQAFEWDIISYNFYPYFWGKRDNWAKMYQFDKSDDPLFRSFMQAGMARVVVTIRPGFEEAAALYLTTGFIWNGGTVPTIGDPLYLDLVAEVTREEPPKKEGKAWITRLPTTLTILQADSIGLKVEKALPCNCGEEDEFEEGTVIPCNSNFEITNAQLGNEGQTAKIQFIFHDLDHLRVEDGDVYDVGTYDDRGYFPRIYESMGEIITINRDASWQPEDSVSIVYEQLAQQLSAINGIEAQQLFVNSSQGHNNPDGIKFTIDTAVIPDFMFIKKNSEGGFDPDYDMLRVITGNESVRIIYGGYNVTGRLQDKSGIPIYDFELNTLLPIAKFKV
ncbi:hypothetical protein E0W68_03905 [Flavobacterium salilacus subsp. salilacus]|uniref:hypothetical protein n=1 Tax=Flavobacterium TaxID=237 RepID=UPI0010750ABF|nr:MULTISPECIES: hypothetical protein [Flavobacterium]KAF2519500.1 hypothetical protein E0W68_03905 [Flavobacterium salilacus subsp. salilacus]MBE1614602.1 hypothetical protein [Flavobacterium sp. SaA2.13]